MQFKHPEILYALLFLIIPVIVHLFNLQRFVKVSFSNVAFLKKIEKKTRKSSQLKKWLVLVTRLFTFACAILAFSQPYFSNFSQQLNTHTILYLDNSYSMQAKSESGRLLTGNSQKIIEHFINKEEVPLSVFTNNAEFKNQPFGNIKNQLINLSYTPKNITVNNAILKAKSKALKVKNTLQNIILVSDFQKNNCKDVSLHSSDKNTHFYWVQTLPKNEVNFFIDRVFVKSKTVTNFVVTAIIKSNQNTTAKIPVSLIKGTQLVGKAAAHFKNSNQEKVVFTLPKTVDFKGKISIQNDPIHFDNTFYFTISAPQKIKVLNIGKEAPYLTKIYTEDEFTYTSVALKHLQYSLVTQQQLIVLNELDEIPQELSSYLQRFTKKGGSLVIIPSSKSNVASYNRFLQKLSLGKIDKKQQKEHQITQINYQHPILKNVFEKRVSNFQYPTSKLCFLGNQHRLSSVVMFDNQQPFIASYKKIYWVASPLNKEVCNFQQSPLIVPIFYNFAKSSYALPKPYYTIGNTSEITLESSLKKEEVVTISNKKTSFIPLQTIRQNHINITLNNDELSAGFYQITKGREVLKTIALNYNTLESMTNYENIGENTAISQQKNHTITNSVDAVFEKINEKHKINWLFKWFLAFSVLFLLVEMLILKFLKP